MNNHDHVIATLNRLEVAIRHGHRQLALRLVDYLRARDAGCDALEATVECALIELDGSTDPVALARFCSRIGAGLDHDAAK